jgi:PAS domain S-box-containing protein
LNYVPLGVAGFAVGVLYFVEEKFAAVSRFGRPQIVEHSPNPVVVLDRADTVREVNAAAREHLPELADAVDRPLASAAPRIDAALDADESVLEVPGEDGDATSYYKHDSTPLTVGATTIGRVVVLVDVTELESTRRELAKRTDLLAQTAELATIGGWELDLRTDTLTWEAETARIHGLAPSETPSVEEAIEFYHPEDRATIRDAVAAAEDGTAYDETCRIVRTDGETRWVRTRGVPLLEDGEVVGIRGVVQDITDQREREQRLRRFQRAVEAAGHAIFITDTDGVIEHANPAFESVTGYSAAEAVGQTPAILNSGEMDSEYFADLWATIEAGEVWTEPIVNQHRSGELYHADETIAPITTADGTTEGYVAIQTDITDRVEAEEELRTFERIVQRLEDPIMLQGTDGEFRVLNDALAEYAGLSVDELVGRDEFAFMDEDSAARIQARKEQVLDTEEPVTYRVSPTFPTEGERSFVTSRYPHYDDDGDVVGTIAICRDVTALRDREEQLRVLARVLRHNLRNEMSVVLGHAEMIAEGTADDPARLAERILDTGADLVALADKERKLVELLTEEPDQQQVDLGHALEELAERSRTAHPLSEVTVECPPDATVEALPQVTDALAEVIENAALHADHDDPRVALTVTREDGEVRIAVRDNGPGIPETERRILTGDGEITPLRHGSGLGLRLVGQVVKQSGGSLRFAENEPSGSVVELVFPTDEAGTDEPTA